MLYVQVKEELAANPDFLKEFAVKPASSAAA